MVITKLVLGVLVLVLLIELVVILLNKPVIRPWHMRWGATDEEVPMLRGLRAHPETLPIPAEFVN